MSSPESWMRVRPQGLYIEPAHCFVDPLEPVETAIVTHGHADHARPGHGTVYATPQTLDIMAIRYGDEHTAEPVPLNYHSRREIAEDVFITLFPAGHILGSAQILIEHRDKRVVVSGDYKRHDDPTCKPFEPVSCDVFITEATFALPVFRHPPIAGEMTKLLSSLRLFSQRCHLVGVYALGKCQRVILALREAGYVRPIYVHGALLKLCEYYQTQGIELGKLIAVSDVDDLNTLAGEIVLAPPSALADRWSRKLPDVLTVMASGWMQIRARAKQRRAELALVISDHSDWYELLQTLRDVNAPDIWVTHGREEALVHQATVMGYNAKALALLGYEEEES